MIQVKFNLFTYQILNSTNLDRWFEESNKGAEYLFLLNSFKDTIIKYFLKYPAVEQFSFHIIRYLYTNINKIFCIYLHTLISYYYNLLTKTK